MAPCRNPSHWSACASTIDRALGSLFESKVFPRITGDDVTLVAMTIIPVGIVFAAVTAYGTLRYYVRE